MLLFLFLIGIRQLKFPCRGVGVITFRYVGTFRLSYIFFGSVFFGIFDQTALCNWYFFNSVLFASTEMIAYNYSWTFPVFIIFSYMLKKPNILVYFCILYLWWKCALFWAVESFFGKLKFFISSSKLAASDTWPQE